MYDTNNIFARILRGEIPAQKVMENEWAVAFKDIQPKAPVHVLIIPRGAYVSSSDFFEKATPDEIVGFYRFLSEVIAQLKVGEKGYRLISNHGLEGGQEVPHFHVHLLAGKSLGPLLSR